VKKHSAKQYTVKQLAQVANISVRTLHHYDKNAISVVTIEITCHGCPRK